MRAALTAHDDVLRNTIEPHGGWLFKHTGDGVIAAFASPHSAVDAAVAAQRALELPVRMGIATGEAELRGDDYFGPILNRAARVMAAGHGGQILLADSTAELITGVDLIDLGPRRLRDVSRPVVIFQVRADGLGVRFPPLKVLDVTPGNLRPPVTSFIGRESEVADVISLLRGCRLVTLTGMGGVGKTRLSIEVADHLINEFADGVWFFELAAVTDPAAVPDAVASVLGITQQPGMSLVDSVAVALEGRVRLLVFDNCEHVLDAAAGLDRSHPLEIENREDRGHQPRETRDRRRTALAGPLSGLRGGSRFRGGAVVRRTRQCRSAANVSRHTTTMRPRWSRSVAASTESRSPSNSRPHAWHR